MKFIEKVKIFTQKNSPEILLGTSIALSIGATVLAFFEAPKALEVIATTAVTKDAIKEAKENPDTIEGGYTEEMAVADTKKTNKYLVTGLCKTMLPVVLLEAGATVCALASFKIMKGRNAALIAAATATEEAYRNYRERVKGELGEEKEAEIFAGKKKVKTTTIDAQTGEVTETEEEVECASGAYDFLFDDANSVFHTKDAEANILFAHRIQNKLDNQLRGNGYLFLKDVYEAFGKTCDTKYAATHGWIYNPKDKTKANYVDLGIDTLYDKSLRGTPNLDYNFWIRPNCDGYILGDGLNDFTKFAK